MSTKGATNAGEPRSLDLVAVAGRAFGGGFFINNILIVALIVLMLYFISQTDAFFTLSNWEVLTTNFAAIGVPVAVMSLLLICGHVDLSIGSNIGFSGTMTALASINLGLPDSAAIAFGIGAGALAGLVNGTLCSVLRFNPIIVTLGMLGVLRGSSLLINSRENYGLGPAFNVIGNGDILGIPILLVIVGFAFIAAAAFIHFTVWGRHIYAIGVNPQAAFLAALPVRALPFALYVATGAAAGVGGVMLVARLDGASPGALGLQMELQALTIILLGGVAFAGGRGRILGVATAWVFLAVLENGLTLMNVTPFVQLVAAGVALVFAASLDALGSALVPRLQQRRRIAEQLEAADRLASESASRDPPASTRPVE